MLLTFLDISAVYAVQAYILPRLTCRLPTFTAATSTLTYLHGLQLADPDYGRLGPIHVIIGSDSYGQIIRPDLIKGDPPSPLAQLTVFGWVISGPVSIINEKSPVKTFHCSIDYELRELLSRFWKQEEVCSPSDTSSPDDANCEDHFKFTHYIITLHLHYR